MDYLASVGIKVAKEDVFRLLATLKSTISVLVGEPYVYADDVSLLNLPLPLSLPSSSAVLMFAMDSIKNRLPVVTISDFHDRRGSPSSDCAEEACAICLNGLERRHEMRELPNCCHAFHKECLDEWMDRHQITCPTCRSSLLPLKHQDAITLATPAAAAAATQNEGDPDL